MRLCLSLLLSKLGQPDSSAAPHIHSSTFTSFAAHSLDAPKDLHILLRWCVQNCTVPKMTLQQSWAKWDNPLPWPTGFAMFDACKDEVFPLGMPGHRRMSQLPAALVIPPDHLEAFQPPCVKPADSENQQINKTLLKILPKFLWRFQHTNWLLQLFLFRWLYNVKI